MKPSSKAPSDKLQALQQEVAILKHEIRLLQSARTFKLASFGKQMLKSKPMDAIKNVRNIPTALRKEHIPTLQLSDTDHISAFSSAVRPASLFRFPNINLAIVDSLGSDDMRFLYETCSTYHYLDSTAEQIASYEALQVIIINSSRKDINITQVKKLLHDQQTLIIYANKSKMSGPVSTLVNQHKNVQYVAPEDLPPAIDIYAINRNLPMEQSLSGLDMHQVNESSDDKLSALSVVDGTIQFSQRQLESLAAIESATIVVSEGSSRKDAIPSISRAELASIIESPLNITKQLIRQSDFVIKNYNYLTKTCALFDLAAISYDNPAVSVGAIVSTKRPGQISHILAQLADQKYPLSKIAIGLHGFSERDEQASKQLIAQQSTDIVVFSFTSNTLFGDVLNSLVAQVNTEFIVKLDDDDYYGPRHVDDLVVAQLYSNADVIGKWNNWVYFTGEDRIYNWTPENALRFSNHIPGGTRMIRSSILKVMKFGKVRRAIDSELYRRIIPRGALLYSTHRYNYVRVRHDDHTYKADPEEWKSRSDRLVINGLDFESVFID